MQIWFTGLARKGIEFTVNVFVNWKRFICDITFKIYEGIPCAQYQTIRQQNPKIVSGPAHILLRATLEVLPSTMEMHIPHFTFFVSADNRYMLRIWHLTCAYQTLLSKTPHTPRRWTKTLRSRCESIIMKIRNRGTKTLIGSSLRSIQGTITVLAPRWRVLFFVHELQTPLDLQWNLIELTSGNADLPNVHDRWASALEVLRRARDKQSER